METPKKITRAYLKKTGWNPDDDLYWHKDGHEYNEIDEFLWIKGSKKGIWDVDEVKKIEFHIA